MMITLKEETGTRRISLDSLLRTVVMDNEEFHEPCDVCDGLGGWDLSTDCEVYDQWEDCPYCLGTGHYQND